MEEESAHAVRKSLDTGPYQADPSVNARLETPDYD